MPDFGVISYIALLTAVYAVAAAVLTGMGLLLFALFRHPATAARDLSNAPVAGWCLGIALLQVWHLWLPVDWRAIPPVLALAGLGFWCRRAAVRGFVQSHGRRFRIALGILLLAAAWIAEHTITQPRFGDSALYHLSAVQWTGRFPIVPGLGNLHDRFAFNNSYFLYAAVLDTGIFSHRSHHLASGILSVLCMARILCGMAVVLGRQGRARMHDVFDALFLVPVIVLTMGAYGFGSSPAPDYAIFVLGFFTASELLWLLETADDAKGRPRNRSVLQGALLFIVLLSAVGVTVKLSHLALALLAPGLAFLALAAARRRIWPLDTATLLWVLSIGIGAFVPWMIRGVILCGYMAYPMTVGAFPVEWRLPASELERMQRVLRGWARKWERGHSHTLGNWRWVWPWLNRIVRRPFEVMTPVFMGALFPLFGILAARGRSQRRRVFPVWLFLLVPVLGIVFWFLTCPMPRYSGVSFWMLGAGGAALALRYAKRDTRAACVLALTAVLFFMNVELMPFVRTWRIHTGPAWTGNTKVMTTRSGLQVHVPVEGDRCWDAPLPCTPYFKTNLRLRVEGDMAKGFVVDADNRPRRSFRE